mgnify:CR=1 FL=1
MKSLSVLNSKPLYRRVDQIQMMTFQSRLMPKNRNPSVLAEEIPFLSQTAAFGRLSVFLDDTVSFRKHFRSAISADEMASPFPNFTGLNHD